MESPRRVAIYIRVSTSEQKVDGYGLEAQQSKLLSYVNDNKALNLTTKKEWIFCDVHTGSDFNRPALQKLLKAVSQKKFDAVLIWKIDRLSRSLKHLLGIFEQFEQQGISFVSVQENIDFRGPIGKLIFQIFGAIAQFERELIKDRTRMGKLASAEMGNFTGTHIYYGYKPIPNPSGKGKKLELVRDEKKWVEQMYQWYIYEDMGDGMIANKLNELGVPKGKYSHWKRQQAKWSVKSVREILMNPIYRGEFIANKTDENGQILPEDDWTIVSIPPCVSELTFHQAQEARQDRVGGRKNTDYLLSGKIIDMTLERPKSFAGAKRHKGGFSYRRKQFDDTEGTHHAVFEVPGLQLEEYVWGKIMDAMKNPEVFIRHYLAKEFTDPAKSQNLESQIHQLREKKINLQTLEMARIESAYERGIYDEDKLQEKLTAKAQEVTRIEETLGDLEDQLRLMSSAHTEVQKLREASEQIKYQLEKLTRPQKKILCHLFIDRIEMTRKRAPNARKWDVSAEIYFRFNPTRVPTKITKGRTSKPHQIAKSGVLKPENVGAGEPGTERYTLFKFSIKLESNRSKVWISEYFQKRIRI